MSIIKADTAILVIILAALFTFILIKISDAIIYSDCINKNRANCEVILR